MSFLSFNQIYHKLNNLSPEWDNKENRRLIGNMLALVVQNGINYLVPLLMIPYLTRVLGAKSFGIYGYAYTVLAYLSIPVRYGFDYSATKHLALIRENSHALNIYFSTVLTTRLLLSLITSLVLLALCATFDRFQSEFLMYSSGVLMLVGTALYPSWFYQGIESMKFMTAINGLFKLSSFILILHFVKSESAYTLAFFFDSLAYLVAGIVGLLIAIKRFRVRYEIVKMRAIIHELRNGWHVFLSGLGTTLYLEANVFILGLTSNYTAIGYYYAAIRTIRAGQQITVPVVQALFPYMSRKLNSAIDAKQGFETYKKVGKAYALALLLIAVFIFFTAPLLVDFYLGTNYRPAISNIKILSAAILIGGMNNYMGMAGIVNLGHQRAFAMFTWSAGFVGGLCCLLLSFLLADTGASLALVIAELTLFVLTYRFLKQLSDKFLYHE